MKFGSMGEIPPSTSGSPGFSLRIARLAAITISANRFQSGSSLKSQWDRLLGSFQSISASTIHFPCEETGLLQRACEFMVQNVLAVLHDACRTADPRLGFGMRFNFHP